MAAATRAEDLAVAWEPQPGPQTALITCPVFEVFYGGARGGGKTDGVLGEFASHAAQYGEHAIGLMVRRTREQLVETVERSKVIYGKIGAKLVDNLWRFPNGARLRFAYLERDADAENYQGHSYTRVYVEEIGTFPSSAPILKLLATLRSGHNVPVGFRATGNPGGPGHQWVKARYIDDAPMGWTVTVHEFENPFSGEVVTRDRVYIPSRLSDNSYLGGQYVANLAMAGSPELVRAWLEGDWNVVLGAYFPEFGARHVVAPCELPKHWARFRAVDWGSYRPFSVGWYAVSDGDLPQFPRGALIRYREWYGCSEPNVGLKLTAEQVAEGIAEREPEKLLYGVIDPATFNQDGGPSIAERMNAVLARYKLVEFHKADNKRVARNGAMGGWDQVRARLVGEDERPLIYFFSTGIHLIRTLPALQHGELNPEDVDTDGEDHAPD
ncbi:MAG TPA: terminase family protein, partial [Salinarimonas sp.]|nr:terminase family protein [Salinarimonas sp.]